MGRHWKTHGTVFNPCPFLLMQWFFTELGFYSSEIQKCNSIGITNRKWIRWLVCMVVRGTETGEVMKIAVTWNSGMKTEGKYFPIIQRTQLQRTLHLGRVTPPPGAGGPPIKWRSWVFWLLEVLSKYSATPEMCPSVHVWCLFLLSQQV